MRLSLAPESCSVGDGSVEFEILVKMMPRSVPPLNMVMRLLLIVTLPGPDNESKRNPVAPPALSVNVLLARFTVDDAPSEKRKPVPFAAAQLTVLPVRLIWDGPSVTI